MGTGTVDFTGVRSTNLVTLYLRAVDAGEAEPILDDRAALEAVDRIDYDFDKLRRHRRSRTLVAMRAKILDEWAEDFLRRHPDATVLHLGVGLDSRAFRLALPAGVRWFDVDYPDVIELRRKLYEESANYRMIGASVTESEWLEQIPADRPTLIIAEGLLMYPQENEVRALLRRLTDRFETGELIFDCLSTAIIGFTGRLPSRLRNGYPLPPTGIDDGATVERWNPRLRFLEDAVTMLQADRVSDRRTRLGFRLWSLLPLTRDSSREFRFAF
ncbi:class I SAM-dependent methyltransferase [Nocardia panacis]|uniref:Class I SAM-dependent methyltransferase n=1 Tax=Nocardia panacis TaxID=2340916 RepID=A0A3A4KVH1_9NOCA|nr:class I SAM-dependent methyltransferase [Nocardia panacis]RJO79240.1 class I SAM-dependent methyltransferase [Nocardia panacis]